MIFGGAPVPRRGQPLNAADQGRAALQGLGYSSREADEAVSLAASDDGQTPDDVADLLKASLRALDRR